MECCHEGIDIAAGRRELVIPEDENPSVGGIGDHAGRPISDEGREVRLHLVEVDEFERNPEFTHSGIPCGLAPERRVRDVTERARLTAQVVPDEVPQFAGQATIGPIDADQSTDGLIHGFHCAVAGAARIDQCVTPHPLSGREKLTVNARFSCNPWI